MKTLGDLLKSAGYTPKDGVAAGQIEKIEIHRENRLVRLKTKFEAFVPYSDLREVNGMLHERILPDMRVELAPAFPAQAWQESCVTSVLERVRELDASLNGTFKDADCTINENTLTIELLHGGLNLLEKRHTDRAISETVQEWFSVPVTVTFTGKTELQNGDESVIERLHVEEEKRARAAAIEEMERYEAAMKEIAAKRRVSVREGKSLMPQIVLETARRKAC